MQTRYGFTMIEMVFVVAIMVVLTFVSMFYGAHVRMNDELATIEMHISRIIDHGKYLAVTENRNVDLLFDTYSLECEGERYELPEDCFFTHLPSLYFNSSGHINKAGHVDMYCRKKRTRIVFHLGTGHYEFQ